MPGLFVNQMLMCPPARPAFLPIVVLLFANWPIVIQHREYTAWIAYSIAVPNGV